MPSTIHQRGKKGLYWYIGHWNGNRYRETLKTTIKAEAERKQRELDVKYADARYLPQKKKNPTTEEFWSKYSEWMKQHREPQTLATQTVFWNQLMEFTKARRLSDLRPDDFNAFKSHRLEKGKAKRSINNTLSDYHTMFNRAIKEKWFTGENPVKGIERFTIDQELPEWHSQEELEQLLNIAEEKDMLLLWAILLASHAGLRKKEIIYLKWDLSFDWSSKNPLIKIVRHDEFRIKTHQQRNVPMAKRIYDAIWPHRKDSGYVFNSNRTSQGKNRYRWDCKKSLESALHEAGLPDDQPFQRLRITFGSMHISKGRPFSLVSTWMGNSEKVIRKYYQGLMPYDAAINDL